MTDDDLIRLAKLAEDAVWRTPKYSTYGQGLADDRIAHYKRENALRVGRTLFDAVIAEGLLTEPATAEDATIIHGCANCGGGIGESTEAEPLFCSARCVQAAEEAWNARVGLGQPQ